MSVIMQYHLVNSTQVLSDYIASESANPDDLAITYALALRSDAAGIDEPDWRAVNKLIIDRWSLKTLDKVKARAWEIYKGRIDPFSN